jgi:GT2 family glycosyltransferase
MVQVTDEVARAAPGPRPRVDDGPAVGLVAIGRNEGERLARCLASVAGPGLVAAVVYVDSGSTDGSAAMARASGAEVVELDRSTPFSAARARNAGFDRLRAIAPTVPYVMFVDGDCEVADGWPARAADELDARPDAAIVCGRNRERSPEASIYNRLADLEWDTPIGRARACGGNAVARASAFEAVGGFDPTASAGEEPELCLRLRRLGWSIWRVDAEMTRHDLAMTRFGQWWRRQVRTGYSGLDVATRFGVAGDVPFGRQIRSARIWTIGHSTATLAFAAAGLVASGPVAGLAAGALIGSAAPLQAARIALRDRRRLGRADLAAAHGILTMISKWGQVLGQAIYFRDRALGRRARLIEHKCPDGSPIPSP